MTRILFDASRLLFRRAQGAPSGIDRVALAYGRWLKARPQIEMFPVWTAGGRIYPMARGLFDWLTSEASMRAAECEAWPRLLEALARPTDDRPALRPSPTRTRAGATAQWVAGAAGRTIATWPSPRLPQSDLYVNVSHYGLEQSGQLRRIVRAGAAPVVMIHDLIPIDFPEFCGPAAAGRHHERMAAVIEHAALILANSEATAAEIRRYALAAGAVTPRLCVAPLGLEPDFATAPAPVDAARRYFVCVGTIEPRKNLAFLLTLWRRIAERMGEATPRLVLVGRRGWECESVVDHLQRSPPVRRYVHEVRDLSDEQLSRLIGGAVALLAPSFAEGFDLPVAEALAVGTPVLASDIPAHRELAASARLLDPLDGRAWLDAIVAAAQRPPPRTSLPPATWERHFEIVAEAMGLPAAAASPVEARQL